MHWTFLILALISLISCNQQSYSPKLLHWQLIPGRDLGQGEERPMLYRALAPPHWMRSDPPESESIADTMKCNCEFIITSDGQEVRLTIHTFPFQEEQNRIPPQAQIARWKKQLEGIDLLTVQILSDAHGGFNGLFFEGQGKWQGNEVIMMAWSMRLAPGYERQLSLYKQPFDHYKRADYTIKAIGSPDAIQKNRADIIQFAQSFELIDELPPPL